MDDPVAVSLEIRPDIAFFFLPLSALRLGRLRSICGQIFIFTLFDIFSSSHYYTPVDPKPPLPLLVSVSISAGSISA